MLVLPPRSRGEYVSVRQYRWQLQCRSQNTRVRRCTYRGPCHGPEHIGLEATLDKVTCILRLIYTKLYVLPTLSPEVPSRILLVIMHPGIMSDTQISVTDDLTTHCA